MSNDNNRPVLPDGTEPPTGDVALVLRLFDPVGITHGAFSRAAIALNLADQCGVAKEPSEIDAFVEDLVSRGLMRPHGRYADPSLGLDDGPGGQDEWFVTTPLGKKAARLCNWLAEPLAVVGGTARQGEALADLVLRAIGRGGAVFESIDAACCCAKTEDVQSALESLERDQWLKNTNQGYTLLPKGVARQAVLRKQQDRAIEAELAAALADASGGPPSAKESVVPLLPDGSSPPAGAARELIAVFDFMQPGKCEPVGRSQLRRAMIENAHGPVADAELDLVLQTLTTPGLLDDAAHPGPMFKAPKLPDLPGIPKFTDLYSPVGPEPGEACYATTTLGSKAAHLSRTLLGRAQPTWRLGPARLADQVLAAFRPPFPSEFSTIDAQCCCAPTSDVRNAVEDSVASGLIQVVSGESYRLTFDGEGRHKQVAEELQKMAVLAQSTATPNSTPSSSLFDVAIICALHTPELEKLKRTGTAGWEPIPAVPDDPSSYIKTVWTTASGTLLRVIAGAPTQMGMPASAVLATKMILRFRPRLVVMAGIAAGAKADNQGFGDILAADKTLDYNAGKLVADKDTVRFEPDPEPIHISPRLRDRLKVWSSERRQLDDIADRWPAAKPRTRLCIHVGVLGSGAAVVDAKAPVAEVLRHWRKLVGIEMEAYGVHVACRDATDPSPAFLCLKAICDFATQKGDDWQDYAAYCAAELSYRFLIAEWDNLHLGNSFH